jgi:pimeloyl-ACP methyl ester carboxylesterase
MDALGLTQSDIVGHSHGGAVTLMLAARHPERVRSLILIAPANPYSHVGDALLRSYNRPLGRLIARAGPYLPRKIQRYALGRMYGDPSRVTERCLQGYIDSLRVPGTIQHILAIVRDWFPEMAKLEVALPRIAKIPTLLVWGDRDRAVDPASADRLLEVLPNSELRKIHDAGHIPFEEMPEQTNRVMLDWLDRDPASGTGRADAAARAGG